MDAGDPETRNILRELDSFGPSSSSYYVAPDRKARHISKEFEEKLNSVNLQKRSQFDVEVPDAASPQSFPANSGKRGEISTDDIKQWKQQVLSASRPVNQWYDGQQQTTSASPELIRSSTAMSNSSDRIPYLPNDLRTISGENTVFSATDARRSQRGQKKPLEQNMNFAQSNENRLGEGIYHAKLCRVEEIDDEERPPRNSAVSDTRVTPHKIYEKAAHRDGNFRNAHKDVSRNGKSERSQSGSTKGIYETSACRRSTERGQDTDKARTDQQQKYQEITERIEKELKSTQTSIGICGICGAELFERSEVVCALGKMFHNACLLCDICGRTLRGKKFYKVDEKFFCEEDYLYAGMQATAEQCASCSHPIINEVLKAFNKSYHPRCFRCEKCKKCLDGIPFALDEQEKVYCMKDYHETYSPRCGACKKPIIPQKETGETVRVVANDKNYHIECYVCEGCCCQLTDEPDKRCYPLNDHLLCKKCHIHWKRTGGTKHLITDL